ncbi:hypothetical protein F4X33_16765 [Candidatus Poribacteria bacterium]|nr:hypothetical protein [Candidatus Poribacteria bacterium]
MICVIAFFIICVGCWVSSGCQPTMLQHSYTHPHSAVTAPTFCLYWGETEHSQPIRIYEITVVRHEAFSDNKPFEWHNWQPGHGEPYGDLVLWQIQYLPDDVAPPLARPFSCIIYGKVPPGYEERIPPVPLVRKGFTPFCLTPRKSLHGAACISSSA